MFYTIGVGMLSASLAISPVIILVLLLGPLLHKNYKPGVSSILWLIIAVRLLIPVVPPAPQITIPVIESTAYWEDGFELNATVSPNTEQQSAIADVAALSGSSPGLHLGTLALVWFAGAVLFSLLYTGMYLHTRRKLLRWSIPVVDEHTLQLLEQCKAQLGIRSSVTLLQCGALATPLLMGLLSPQILLPEIGVADAQIRCILLHELAHHRRRDLWVKLLWVLLVTLYWFHPLVWLAAAKAEADLEIACDAAVLTSSGAGSRREYGNTILSFIQSKKAGYIPLTTSFFENHNQMIRRFERIMDTKIKKSGAPCVVLVFVAVLLGASLVGCVSAQAALPEIPVIPIAADVPDPEAQEEGTVPSFDEQKEIYLRNPQHYQAEQAAFQEEISRIYAQQSVDEIEYTQGQMQWPVADHYAMTAPYGWRYGGIDYHTGIDISDPEIMGQPVLASAGGSVLYVNTEDTQGKGYGLFIIVGHGGGLTTVYGHLSEISVKQGDIVEAGQVIGKVGATGFAAEPQLHFEVREEGVHVNVQRYLLPAKTEKGIA